MNGETPEQKWNRLQREYQKGVQNGAGAPKPISSKILRRGPLDTRISKKTANGSM
jgi:hypothetical protein